jgi:putative phosphoesterase
MQIAVISDTHDRLPTHVAAAIASADEIWHLGDVCEPAVLDEVKILGPKVRVVRGNCDAHTAWPLVLNFKLGGLRFHLEHIPPRVPPPGCDFFLHGHTHVPRDETVGGVRFLNPGCITRPNRGAPASYAWLKILPDGAIEWSLVRL